MSEPKTAEEITAWIAAASRRRDAYEDVRLASHAHRVEHGYGCTVFPTDSGPLLGLLAKAVGAGRVLDVGTGLGYSALWLADGGAVVETIERDPGHAELARANVAAHGARVDVVVGDAVEVLRADGGPYDLVFSDADPAGAVALLDEFARIVRAGGLLVSSNLFLAQFADDIRGLDELARYRDLLLDDACFETAFVPGGMAISIRR